MKMIFVICAALALTVSAQAAGPKSYRYKCTGTKKAVENGYSDMTVKVTKDEITGIVHDDQGKSVGDFSAERDENFKDDDQYRFVDHNGPGPFSSDGDTGYFVDKELTKGQNGNITVSSQGVCDGDACRRTLDWSKDGSFKCKTK